MSSIIRDIAEEHLNIGISINDFLFENGKPFVKGGKDGVIIHHTEDEYIDFLKSLQTKSFNSYKKISKEYGWN